MSTVLRVAHAHADRFQLGFVTWLADNLHVYDRFEAEARKLRRRGRTHYSARTIIEVLRHESALAEIGEALDYKLNNNHAPDLARLYALVTGDETLFHTRGR